MGKYNSSATRVVPFFHALMQRDRSGESWLAAILSVFPNRGCFSQDVLLKPGGIITCQFGKELRLNPPLRFLKWMIQNPNELNWPRHKIKNKYIVDMRERLMLRGSHQNTPNVREQVIQQATAAIDAAIGAADVERCEWLSEWWVLEGRTHVDCYIETTRLRLFIEGKRTEKLSSNTSWYSKRNQLLRNLECASVQSSGHDFAELLITETPFSSLPSETVATSLPHLTGVERSELLTHFAGSATWRTLCVAVQLDYESLPDTLPA